MCIFGLKKQNFVKTTNTISNCYKVWFFKKFLWTRIILVNTMRIWLLGLPIRTWRMVIYCINNRRLLLIVIVSSLVKIFKYVCMFLNLDFFSYLEIYSKTKVLAKNLTNNFWIFHLLLRQKFSILKKGFFYWRR